MIVFIGIFNDKHKELFKLKSNVLAAVSKPDKIVAVNGKALCAPAFSAFYYLTKNRGKIKVIDDVGNKCGGYANVLSVGRKNMLPSCHVIGET